MEKQDSNFDILARATARKEARRISIEATADAIVRQAGGDQRAACALMDDIQAAVNTRLREAANG